MIEVKSTDDLLWLWGGREGSYGKDVKSGAWSCGPELEIDSQITFAVSSSLDELSIVPSGFLTCVRKPNLYLWSPVLCFVSLYISLYEIFSSVRV